MNWMSYGRNRILLPWKHEISAHKLKSQIPFGENRQKSRIQCILKADTCGECFLSALRKWQIKHRLAEPTGQASFSKVDLARKHGMTLGQWRRNQLRQLGEESLSAITAEKCFNDKTIAWPISLNALQRKTSLPELSSLPRIVSKWSNESFANANSCIPFSLHS